MWQPSILCIKVQKRVQLIYEKKQYFERLDGLKSIAYLCIFLQHTGIKSLKFGGWGFSFFFVLTGFLLTHSYYNNDRIVKCNIKNNLKFAIEKTKPLFLLNIVCIIFYTPLLFIGDVSYSFFSSLYGLLVMLSLFRNGFL